MNLFSSIGFETTIGEALKNLDSRTLQIVFVVSIDSVLIGSVTVGDVCRGLLKGLILSFNAMDVGNKDFLSLFLFRNETRIYWKV